jgi:hypothetical protein
MGYILIIYCNAFVFINTNTFTNANVVSQNYVCYCKERPLPRQVSVVWRYTDDTVWMKERHLEQLHGPKNLLISVNVKENRDIS